MRKEEGGFEDGRDVVKDGRESVEDGRGSVKDGRKGVEGEEMLLKMGE